MATSAKLILHHYYRSSCSWRVRWALTIKGVSYATQAVNLLANEQLSPAYLKHNPMGQVPCLQVGTQFFSDSLAILEWLEETIPTPALLPQDPPSRLRTRQLMNIIGTGTQPLQNLALQRYWAPDLPSQHAFARHWINRGLAAYEQLLTTSSCSGTFSMGANLTFADLSLIPQCYNALRFGTDLNAYPLVAGIYARAMALPSCQESAPERYLP